MGMAASQARYLALTARKTNTEYEGQQLNQERVVLANRTADLFNQMLSISVPTCPDSNDFTRVQYSWSDGYNDSVLSDYYQLSTADEEYNYVVTSYHYEDVYTGSRKQMRDPKIQSDRNLIYRYTELFNRNKSFFVSSMQYDFDDDKYTLTQDKDDRRITKEFTRVDDGGDIRLELDAIYDRTIMAHAADFEYDEATGNYIYNADDGSGGTVPVTYVPVDTEDEDSEVVKLLKKTYKTYYNKDNKYFYDAEYGTFIEDDGTIERSKYNQGMPAEITIRKIDDGSVYYTDGERYVTEADLQNITKENNELVMKHAYEDMTFSNYSYVGNCKLHLLTKEDYADEDVQTELRQIILDMQDEEKGNKISAANLAACFDPVTGEYIGGIYSFKLNGVKYYTTENDLETSARSAFTDKAQEIADNNIDPQLDKLVYYKAVYLNTKIEDTQRALLETDGKGRFKSVRFEDDSTVYTLNTETITDEEAYRDAMNQYYYKQEKYDKAIRDINAKTELIQQEDRTLELRLKQLDTEQNALQTEMEAVKKVISKNVESTFKTFAGG